MVSRIDIGPDGGPYVEIDEDAGDLVIRVPNDTVDFDSNDLLNAVLQNATMDGGSLDGVSLASALDANNQDLNSVGTASVTALEAESVSTERASIGQTVGRLFGAGDEQTIPDDTTTKLEWSDVAVEDADIVDVSTANDEMTIQADGDYLVIARTQWLNDGWSAGDGLRMKVFVNGSRERVKQFRAVSDDVFSTDIIADLPNLSSGDIIDIRVQQSSGSEQTARQNLGDDWTGFSVRRVA